MDTLVSDNDETATNEKAKAISAIDKTTVHQICSGQVVLNLATAIKELVENSLDAGATQIEVKLKDHGATLIEVTDNGSGVEEENFQGLTLKHHTSKLTQFQDLVEVQTFGFRGEALSSLCALAKLSISTRHKDAKIGSNINYDHNGRIVKVEKSARSVGTTVTLSDIFSTMPVRFKEFQRNIKKEFSKLCQVLNSYCLVSTGVRIQCVNTVGKSKRNIVLATKGEQNVKDNITSVFGSKQSSSVREIVMEHLTDEELSDIGIRKNISIPDVQLKGYISSCNYGEGRGATDRQFFYINNRPCDPNKISKLINEVYHFYNRTQYPFVYLNIITQRTTVDVNITPDKRQVFLQNEKYLCCLIRKSLDGMFKDTPRDILINIQEPLQKRADSEKLEIVDEKVNLASLKRKFSSLKSENMEGSMAKQPIKKQPKIDFFITKKSLQEPDHLDKENSIDAAGDAVNTENLSLDHHHSVNANSQSKKTEDGLQITFDDFQTLSQANKNETNEDLEPENRNGQNCSTETKSDDFQSIYQSNNSTLDNKRISTTTNDSAKKGVQITFDDFHSSSQQRKEDVSNNETSSSIQMTFDDLNSLSQRNEENDSNEDRTTSSQSIQITFDDLNSLSQRNEENDSNEDRTTSSQSIQIKFDDLNSLSQRNEENISNEDEIRSSQGLQISFDDLKSLSQRNEEGEGARITFDGINSLSQSKEESVSNSNQASSAGIQKFENIQSSSQKTHEVDSLYQSDENGGMNEINKVVTNDITTEVKISMLDCSTPKIQKKEVKVNFSMREIEQSLEKIKVDQSLSSQGDGLKFSAKINPKDNKTAEKELNRQISKTDFRKMKIFGQFNLGFIIAGLDRDLFIVDQHATDEKYNFERLQASTVINSQPMVTPQSLELTAVNENILMDNLDIFHKNGFKFKIDEDAPPTQRVKLSHLPMSKNWTFGKEDIDELLFMISENPEGTVLRPSRVRAMFASRSCRSSVMIGKSLSKGEMRRLVDHMGEIEQPWNCPHGRPTIRHLVNTDLV